MQAILEYLKMSINMKSFECDEAVYKDYLGCRVSDDNNTAYLNIVIRIDRNEYLSIFESMVKDNPRTRNFWLFTFVNNKIVKAKRYYK